MQHHKVALPGFGGDAAERTTVCEVVSTLLALSVCVALVHRSWREVRPVWLQLLRLEVSKAWISVGHAHGILIVRVAWVYGQICVYRCGFCPRFCPCLLALHALDNMTLSQWASGGDKTSYRKGINRGAHRITPPEGVGCGVR